MTEITAPIIGINRHRILTDGKGITTLVGFYGCPLRCKYCLNPHSVSKDFTPEKKTVAQLIEELMCDDIYFRATGGGICFTGGEPLLHTEFIKEFKRQCPSQWKIYLETSLNVPRESLQSVQAIVDGFIIDIKDMNPKIYKLYTGKDNDLVISNLKYLSSNNTGASIVIRIPSIPYYNRYPDLTNSYKILESIGFGYNQFDELTYIKSRDDHYDDHFPYPWYEPEDDVETMTSGKAICAVLKSVREYISEYNGIPSVESKCTHKGHCKGTCPKCESELKSLASQNVSIPSQDSEHLLDSLIANLPDETQRALKTNYVEPRRHGILDAITTDGMFPRPEKYSATEGPLQGDLDTCGMEMKPLSEED